MAEETKTSEADELKALQVLFASKEAKSERNATLRKILANRELYPDNLAMQCFDLEWFLTLSEKQQSEVLWIVHSGTECGDSSVGCYACRFDDYVTYNALLGPVLAGYHKVSLDAKHVSGWKLDGIDGIPEDGKLDLSSFGVSPLSMRVRVGRNLEKFPLAAAMTRDDRVNLEKDMYGAFQKLIADPTFGGAYYSLTPDHPCVVTEEKYQELVNDHLMFKDIININNLSLDQRLTVDCQSMPPHTAVFDDLSQSELFEQAFKMYSAMNRQSVDLTLMAIISRRIQDGIQNIMDDPSSVQELSIHRMFRATAAAKKQKKVLVDPLTVELILRALTKVKIFERLKLDNIALNESQMAQLATLLMANPNFVELNFRNTGMNVQLMKSLCSVLSRSSGAKLELEVLNLNENDLKKGEVFDVLRECGVVSAKKLYCINCKLNEASLHSLVDLLLTPLWNENKRTATFKLDISSNDLSSSDRSAAMSAQELGRYFKRCGYLSALNIRGCNISLNVLTELMLNASLVERTLQVLECGGNLMTPYGANAMAGIIKNARKLGYVSIRDVPLQAALLQILLEGASVASEESKEEESSLGKRKIHLNFDFSKSFPETGVRTAIKGCDPMEIVQGIASVDITKWQSSVIRGFLLKNLNLGAYFKDFCSGISRVNSLVRLCLDLNFTTSKRKGNNRENMAELASVISSGSMESLEELIIMGDLDGLVTENKSSKLFLTANDLQPLFAVLNETERKCCLKQLVLDGNKLEDSGAIDLANNLSQNKHLEIVSIEDCKIGHKGVLALVSAISEDSRLQSLLPTRTMASIQASTNKKNWSKITDVLQSKLPILYSNLEAYHREQVEKAAAEQSRSELSPVSPSVSVETPKRRSAAPPPKSETPRSTRGSASAKPPPRSGAKPPPSKKKWPPVTSSPTAKAAADERKAELDTIGKLPTLSLPKGRNDKKRHSVIAGLSRSGGDTSNVKQLAGLLAGKPLMGVQSYPIGMKRSSAVKSAADMELATKVSGTSAMSSAMTSDSASGRIRTYSIQFSAGDMKIESADSVDAKMSAPTGPPKGKRKKRTRKKIDV